MLSISGQLVIVALLLPTVSNAAPLCAAGTAADYIALAGTGCTDSKGALISGFTLSTAGTVVPSSNILVTPTTPDIYSYPDSPYAASGLTLNMSPFAVIPGGTTFDFTIGLTITMPSGTPITQGSMAGWEVWWVAGGPALHSYHEIVVEDGTLIRDTQDNCCFGTFGPLKSGSSTTLSVSYSVNPSANTYASFQKVEIGVARLEPAPEPASWLLVVTALVAVGVLGSRTQIGTRR